MLAWDEVWLYLEYCEDGGREGIEIRGWCFILEIESGEKQEMTTRAVRDKQLPCSLQIPRNPSQGASFVPPGNNTPGNRSGEHGVSEKMLNRTISRNSILFLEKIPVL